MMNNIGKDINYKYLIGSFVVLVIVFIFLKQTKENIIKDKKHKILIQTDNGIISSNTDAVRLHLTELKQFLLYVCKMKKIEPCKKTLYYLNKVKKDLELYLNINNNINCNYREQLEKNSFSFHDKYNYLIEDFKGKKDDIISSLINIILLIENINVLLENNFNMKGILKLENLHNLILMIQNKSCEEKSIGENMENVLKYNMDSYMENLDNIEKLNIIDEKEYHKYNDEYKGEIENFGMMPNTKHFTPRVKSSNHDISHEYNKELVKNGEESDTFCNEEVSLTRSINMVNSRDKYEPNKKYKDHPKQVQSTYNHCNSQVSYNKYNGQDPNDYNTWYDLDDIREERYKLLKKTTDLNCKRSLRQDYGNLEANFNYSNCN